VTVTIEAIRQAVQAQRWRMSGHARFNAVARHIAETELLASLAGGEIIEDYPTDPRGASALVLGHAPAGRPLHAVCTLDAGGTLLIITVYEPQMPWWTDERTRSPKGGSA
jgi:hypothetical protein